MNLEFSWQCVPYIACCVALLSLGLLVAAMRGDQVMRLGTLGAVTTTFPWALCSLIVACTHDAEYATRLLRIGNGPVSLIGPNLLLVLLGVTGQLERQRWLARLAGVIGTAMCGVCWTTPWTVPGVHKLSTGMFYLSAGPLTWVHVSQLGFWLVVGVVVARRGANSEEKRRLSKLILAILGAGVVAAADILLVYQISNLYPMAWAATLGGCGLAGYLVLRADLLRAQGIDRKSLLEIAALVVGSLVVAYLAVVMAGATSIALALAASGVWVVAIGLAWAIAARSPALAAAPPSEIAGLARALGDTTDEAAIEKAVAAAWAPLGITEVRLDRKALPADVATWLANLRAPIALHELGTMRLGALRGPLERLFDGKDLTRSEPTGEITSQVTSASAAGRPDAATLVVPLVDRNALLGILRATHAVTLRDITRGLVTDGARLVAQALAFSELAAKAAEQGELARELEVATAMRAQASSSSRADEAMGRWTVAAEYRSAARTTGAGWSCALLPDGRLAMLATEAQAHGVSAALATAALTGAFAAATTNAPGLAIDDLLAALRASAEGIVRGSEPVAAFVAILGDDKLEWASAGHPGGVLISEVVGSSSDERFATGSLSDSSRRPKLTMLGAGGGGGGGGGAAARLGASLAETVKAARGTVALPADGILVVASTELHGDDDTRWRLRLFEAAGSGSRMAATLVDKALDRGAPLEDLLAVIVRVRAS